MHIYAACVIYLDNNAVPHSLIDFVALCFYQLLRLLTHRNSRARLSHHAFFHRPSFTLVSVFVQIDEDIFDGLPAVTDIERERPRRRLDVGRRAGSIGGEESVGEKHGANAAALLGGSRGENMKILFWQEEKEPLILKFLGSS